MAQAQLGVPRLSIQQPCSFCNRLNQTTLSPLLRFPPHWQSRTPHKLPRATFIEVPSKADDLERLEKEARLHKGRAALRAWWYAQQLQKAEEDAKAADSMYAQAFASAKESQMEEGRAVLRLWWLDQRLQKLDPSRDPHQPFPRTRLVQTPRKPLHSTRPPLNNLVSYPRLTFPETPTPSKPEPKALQEASEQGVSSELKIANPKPLSSRPSTVVTKQSSRSTVDDLIEREVQREKETRERQAQEARAEKQRRMDAGRAAMRKWWVQERESTKRALGLPPYKPVWTLFRTDGEQGPISIGKTPLMVGSDVSRMERVIPVQMDYPTVSRVHARIYGKDVLRYGEYHREYFVVDLKSTNGVRLNNKMRLRPGDEYKLSDGDVLSIGEEAATLIIKKPQ